MKSTQRTRKWSTPTRLGWWFREKVHRKQLEFLRREVERLGQTAVENGKTIDKLGQDLRTSQASLSATETDLDATQNELDDLHFTNASQGMTILNIDKKCKLPNKMWKQLNHMKAFSQLPPTEISKRVCNISRLTDIIILWLCDLIWLEISSLIILPIRLYSTN